MGQAYTAVFMANRNFIIVNWLQSVVRLTLRLMQENLAEVMAVVRTFLDEFLRSHENHLSGSITSLASDLLSNLEAL